MEKVIFTEEEIISGLRKDCISCGNMLKQLPQEVREAYAEYVLDGQGMSARTYYLILYKLWKYSLFVKLLELGDDAVEAYLLHCANKSIRRTLGDGSTKLSLFKDIIFKRGKSEYIAMLKKYELFEQEDETDMFRCQRNIDASENNVFVFSYIRDNKLYSESINYLTRPGYKVFLKWYIQCRQPSSREKFELSVRKVWNKILDYLMLTD